MGAESYTGRINRKLNKKLRIVEVAAGRERADLVLKNAAYVNVFSSEICHGVASTAVPWFIRSPNKINFTL